MKETIGEITRCHNVKEQCRSIEGDEHHLERLKSPEQEQERQKYDYRIGGPTLRVRKDLCRLPQFFSKSAENPVLREKHGCINQLE